MLAAFSQQRPTPLPQRPNYHVNWAKRAPTAVPALHAKRGTTKMWLEVPLARVAHRTPTHHKAVTMWLIAPAMPGTVAATVPPVHLAKQANTNWDPGQICAQSALLARIRWLLRPHQLLPALPVVRIHIRLRGQESAPCVRTILNRRARAILLTTACVMLATTGLAGNRVTHV